MSDKQTQEVKIVYPRKKSWFNWCTNPNMSDVVEPVKLVKSDQQTHAIGRRIPKSVDDQSSFGF